MHLIVGLGNPGNEYAGHRHNVGFMIIDQIASDYNFPPFRSKFNALLSEKTIDGEKVVLAKPQTYMNKSGDSVVQIVKFYKIEPKDVSVIHDELDLPAGKMRIKIGGGHGGHNGLKSIDAHIGREYHRVRIGIDHPGHKDRVHGHVLSNFHKADSEWLDEIKSSISKNIILLVKGDGAGLMNKVSLHKPEQTKAMKPAPSHTKQAQNPATEVSGPMASMLKKLFGTNKDNQ